MKKLLTVSLSLIAACTLLVSALCVGGMGVSAAVTGTFTDYIVAEFAVPEIVDYSTYGVDISNMHRIACEINPDLGATLLIKAAEPRDPSHTEYITYKMSKNIAGFEFDTMCCAGLGNPLEDITVFISKTGADGSWAQVKTQATRYTFDPNIYAHFDKAYWHQSKLMNAQKIPTGYKYLKIQFNGNTGSNDVPWNIAIDTVTIFMGTNVAAPVIPEDQTFLTYEELKDLPTTEPSEPTTPPTEPSEPSEPTTPPTEPSQPTQPTVPEAPTQNPLFVVGDAVAKNGDTVTLPVYVYNNPGIVGMHVYVNYDPNAMTLTGVEGKDFANMEFGPLTAPFSAIWLDALNDNNTTNGALMELTFAVKKRVFGGKYSVEIYVQDAEEIFDANLQPVAFEFYNGTITVDSNMVPPYTPGDLTNDGKINARDLGRLQQYINNWDVTIILPAADVNGDDAINVRDLGMVQQYINGWDVTLLPAGPALGGPGTEEDPDVPTEPEESILTEEERALYQNVVDTENAWLASMQLPNGALPMTYAKSGTLKLCPYFSDFAALSMLNQANLYADNVKKYMDWHFSHLNTAATDYNGVDGTIYDYNAIMSNGQVVREEYINGTPSYDSTDSYAATFLKVLQKYAEKTGDTAYIIAHKAEIERIVNALYSTMVGGLTLAKPDYRVKYLMDNCEVYEGMVAGAKLYADVLIPADASLAATGDKLAADAALVAEKIESQMWNNAGNYYYPALNEGGTPNYTFSWSNFYPSATAQPFPVIFGLIDPASDRAQQLYADFCSNVKWETMEYDDTFYWGSNVQFGAMMKDTARVTAYLELYSRVAMRNHAYPLYNSDAAKVAMAAYYLLQM